MHFGLKWAKYTWLPEIIKWTARACAFQQNPSSSIPKFDFCQAYHKSDIRQLYQLLPIAEDEFLNVYPEHLLEVTHVLSFYRKVLKTWLMSHCLFTTTLSNCYLSLEKKVTDSISKFCLEELKNTQELWYISLLKTLLLSQNLPVKFFHYDLESTKKVPYHMKKGLTAGLQRRCTLTCQQWFQHPGIY